LLELLVNLWLHTDGLKLPRAMIWHMPVEQSVTVTLVA